MLRICIQERKSPFPTNLCISTPKYKHSHTGKGQKNGVRQALTNAIFSDYLFEGRYIVDGPSIKSPSFLSRGTYFSSNNFVPPALTTTR